MPFDILSVTGLFAYQHHFGVGATFAEHCLRGAFPYVATAAFLGRLPQKSDASGRIRSAGEFLFVAGGIAEIE